uniref:hypothetical protein n=1 Tax=Flavobacterium sp. TaxID=239 RepID=UPI004049308B
MTTKILTFILTLSFILKIIIWLLTDGPISRSSMLVIGLLMVILNVKNKLTWSFALIFLVSAIASIFLNFNVAPSNAWVINPFLFLDSILHSLDSLHLKTNKIWNGFLGIIPLLLYIFLLIKFITPKFRKKYFTEKIAEN